MLKGKEACFWIDSNGILTKWCKPIPSQKSKVSTLCHLDFLCLKRILFQCSHALFCSSSGDVCVWLFCRKFRNGHWAFMKCVGKTESHLLAVISSSASDLQLVFNYAYITTCAHPDTHTDIQVCLPGIVRCTVCLNGSSQPSAGCQWRWTWPSGNLRIGFRDMITWVQNLVWDS